MSSNNDLLDRALGAMQQTGIPVEDAERTQARRKRLVPRLERFADEAATQRRKSVGFRKLLAAAALVVFPSIAAGAWYATSTDAAPVAAASVTAVAGDVALVHDGQTASVSAEGDVALGDRDRIRTGASGGATVNLSNGAAVAVGANTEVSVQAPRPSEEVLLLNLGRVNLRVPRLAQGHILAVQTPHAKVVVRGTRFSVEVVRAQPGAPLATRVAVDEGQVAVVSGGRETLLGPGTRWSSARQDLEPSTARIRASRPTGIGDTEASRPTRPRSYVQVTEPRSASAGSRPDDLDRTRSSTLAEENRLFRAAMKARRAGDAPRALSLLDELLRRYPRSPLAVEARTEKARAHSELEEAQPSR